MFESPLQRLHVNLTHLSRIRGHDDYGLDRQRVIDITRPILIRFTDDVQMLTDNPACEKSGDIELLPGAKSSRKTIVNFVSNMQK